MNSLVELPLDEWFLVVGHSIDDEFCEPAVENAGLLPDSVVPEQITELPFAIRARRAQIFLRLGLRTVAEGVQHLLELHTAGDGESPVGEVMARHDGESGTASAAVILGAMRRHLAEL